MDFKEWKKYKLGNLVSLNEKSIGNSFLFDEIEYIDTSSVTHNQFESFQILKKTEAPSRAKRIVRNGDTILSTVRPIQKHFGLIKNAKSNTIASTGFVVITPKHIQANFLYYYLSQDNVTLYLNGIAETTTTTFPAFRPNTIAELEITCPDIATQTRIAAILTSIDAKIELNRETNATLEAMAQTLFQEMCLPKKGADMEDWREGKLGDVVEINMGQSPAGTSYNQIGEGMIFFQGKAEFGFRFPTIDKYTTEPKKWAQKFDTLLSVRAPVGTINMAAEKCCIGRGLSAISGKNDCWSFAFYLLKSLEEKLDNFNGEGTVFGAINKTDLGNIEIVIPPQKNIKDFEKRGRAIDELIFNNDQEIQTLTTLRDSLLPKLMRGEIVV